MIAGMSIARLIHGLTDLCLGTLVGVSVGTSVAAGTIFGISREHGFDKHIANTLAGTMFDRLGWPMLIVASLALLGCLYAVRRPPQPVNRAAARVMAVAAALMFAGAALTQFHFAPTMKHLRETSTWTNGELADPAQKTAFASAHGWSMAVSGMSAILAAGLIVSRRMGRTKAQPVLAQ